jgi:hypothetical protein
VSEWMEGIVRAATTCGAVYQTRDKRQAQCCHPPDHLGPHYSAANQAVWETGSSNPYMGTLRSWPMSATWVREWRPMAYEEVRDGEEGA